MRKLITGLLCMSALALAGAAQAEQWRYFPVAGGAVAFDAHSIRADVITGTTSVNTVVHFSPPQLAPAGLVSFRAERLTYQCQAGVYRMNNSAVYNLQGGSLARYPDSDWIQLDQALGSVALFRRVVCTLDEPPVIGEAGNFTELYEILPRIAAAAQASRQAAAPPTPPAPASRQGEAAAGENRQPPQLRD